MADKLSAAVLAVARQAVEYVRGAGNKPHFVKRADGVIRLAQAVAKGEEVGQKQGWDVFECCGMYEGKWMVEWDSDQEPHITQDEAVRLARVAGVSVNDDGFIVDAEGKPVTL